MISKVSILGKGTAGVISYLKMLSLRNTTGLPLQIDWYYDSSTKSMSVGEGTTPTFPQLLSSIGTRENPFGLQETKDMPLLDSRPKFGIEYENWGKSDYVHPFNMGYSGIHFNASKFQDYVFQNYTDLENVTLIDRNVQHSDIDSDIIIDCTGAPKSFEDYSIPKYIPVNAVHVTQCDWPDEAKGLYTKTIARPWGWVFVIPLETRCSVGYLYNHNISTLDQVKADVENVIDELGVVPNGTTNSFHFNNYVRNKLIDGNVVYAGNSGFFLEPMEATTLDCVNRVLNCIDFNGVNEMWNPVLHLLFQEIEYFIMAHYASGSKWNNEFWDYATERGSKAMKEAISIPFFKDLYTMQPPQPIAYEPYFGYLSYKNNLEGLGFNPMQTSSQNLNRM